MHLKNKSVSVLSSAKDFSEVKCKTLVDSQKQYISSGTRVTNNQYIPTSSQLQRKNEDNYPCLLYTSDAADE